MPRYPKFLVGSADPLTPAQITVPVTHYRPLEEATDEPVSFTVFHEGAHFRAVPSLTKEERVLTGLPGELVFCFQDQCITRANDPGDDALKVIKQILLELEARELL
ncbi:hypothetical protein [Flaviaesturariibacter amylovorans]|uniref:Uncharacterized protein n=1 Tax=Flaviaesturariibacter amylovorans TaxID=1084520 RepID=A0ABP8H009_9BACT